MSKKINRIVRRELRELRVRLHNFTKYKTKIENVNLKNNNRDSYFSWTSLTRSLIIILSLFNLLKLTAAAAG